MAEGLELVPRSRETGDSSEVSDAVARVMARRPELRAYAARVLGHRGDPDAVVDECVARLLVELRRAASEIRDPVGWMRTAVLRRAIDANRERSRRRPHLELLARQASSNHAAMGGADPVEDEESRAVIRRALLELPTRQRNVVTRRDMEGRSYREIADELGIEEATARSHAQAAREALRQKLAAWRRGES